MSTTTQPGTIVREIHVEASPAVVFEVITSPEHLRGWWPDDAVLDPTPGAVGELVFGERGSPDAQIPKVTVVDAVPGHLFSFRWISPEDEAAAPGNSLLVTFVLTPVDGGTHVRMTETGFRENGWDEAVAEQHLRDHESGWDHYIPRLGTYVSGLVAGR
jgi:uncharacterized protein YndB with AHSA1/START domain